MPWTTTETDEDILTFDVPDADWPFPPRSEPIRLIINFRLCAARHSASRPKVLFKGGSRRVDGVLRPNLVVRR
jgi:hypothetical protein